MLEINEYNDLIKLIENQVEESIHLDYKSAEALSKSQGKKTEIAKDVSSFANSDGGIIIYGISEYNETINSHLPEKIDPIKRTEFSKEWLEQVINSNISPKINDVTIKSINVENSGDEVVYVVIIGKSTTAHQSNDYRYYKRHNFMSTAMYDYEVRDIMNRNKFPKIELIFDIEQYKHEVKPFSPSIQLPFQKTQNEIQKEYKTYNTLKIYAFNKGSIYTNYVNCFLEIPSSLLDEKKYMHIDKYEKNNILYQKIYCDNTVREVKEVTTIMNSSYPKYWPSRYDPILPDTKMKLEGINLKSNFNISSGTIYWSVNADNADKVTGEIEIIDIAKNIKTL